MSLALRREDFDFEPMAPVDWQRAFEAVETVKDFVKVVDKFERDSLIWRAKMKNKLEVGLKSIENAAEGLDYADVRKQVIPFLDNAVSALEKTQSSFSKPLHDRLDVKASLDKISRVYGAAGKLIRKQLDRIENTRVAQYNACVDMYYAIIGFRSKYDYLAGESESFDNADDLEAFLKSQVA